MTGTRVSFRKYAHRAPGRPSALLQAVLIGLLLCGLAEPLHAQSVAGQWNATWAQGVRSNGSELVEVQRWGRARLDLALHGDSVSGTWLNETGNVTWQVTGVWKDGLLRLDATVHDSDEPELAALRALHWQATLVEDRLQGEMWIDLAGNPNAPVRRPWSAVRQIR